MELQRIQYGDWSAVILLGRGATCISLRNEKYGARPLREPEDYTGQWDNPYLYGMPILFPVNRISGGHFAFEGREYRFPINEPATGCHLHGTLHETAFELVELSEEYERDMKNYLPTGRRMALDAVSWMLGKGSFSPFGKPISRHYRAGGAGRMLLVDPVKRLCLVYENDRTLRFRLICNGNADGYICLEPQTCLANAPNAPIAREETGFDWIEPKQSKEYRSKIILTEEQNG